MESGPKTAMEILEVIRDLVMKTTSGTIELADLHEQGLDETTAKEFAEIIEFCQRSAPRVTTFVGGNGEEESSDIKVLIGHGSTPAEIIRAVEGLQHSIDRITRPRVADRPVPDDIQKIRDRVLLSHELIAAIQGRRYRSTVIHDIPRKETSLRMKCVVCGTILDAPFHCDEGPLQVNATLKALYCDFCGFRGSIPKHCGKHVALVYYDNEGPILTMRVSDSTEEV